ncbi:MAG: short-chain dehydrogenase [Microbacterium sp.]|uniref:Short-chain dehydrogenase n=1 Tax=Microbacterium ginsengisoli TaxID=400772 RepID=A0A3C1KH39_9MICO|nr:SDR family oxidoreductase [uncultured Microbacterium sp.]MAL06394.1 short-chain dehydrogenase [Microbacterium sp.]MBN9207176.1 SDR family oxidoreductase [Microbacterium ginsengisoli]HAN25684.1 short-chain dehydrogenase [Microbacterium ginsengisoli]
MSASPRTILITGSSSGMGLTTVEAFLADGWHVLAVDITAPATGPADALVPLVADVRERDALEAALAAALAPGSRIDAIANIAGIYPPTTLDTYDEATYRRIFDINVLGVLNVIAAARPYLGDGSAIVNFASVDAYEVSRGQLLYGASKAAVTMLTKSLALELAGAGIRVNGIAPGWVATPGNAATGRMDAAAASIPLGRVARPEEISAWVRILVDPASVAFMTGETVVLSGGDVIR